MNPTQTDKLCFFEDIVRTIPRLLSLLDRNPNSPTYGCFDRNYWHYKTQTDFPAATYQHGVLILALCYNNRFAGNIYYRNPDLLRYIKAGMAFWSKIQNRDGSFNEWYPNEHSYVATAVTTYAISEAWLILKDEIGNNNPGFTEISGSIGRAACWLSKNKDEIALNHVAAAVMALHNAYEVCGNARFKEAAQFNIEAMQRYQHGEGWFAEYGGADIGYLSVSIDFLAKYYQKAKDAKAAKLLEKALDFMVYFLHPDGSSGGEYASRNTKYMFLHGLKIASSEYASARWILEKLSDNAGANPLLMVFEASDDRYFTFFFLGNLLQASLEQGSSQPSGLSLLEFTKIFPGSGLFSVKNKNFHIIGNFKKGGVFKVFSSDRSAPRLFYGDSGYFGCLAAGAVISTQYFNGQVLFNIKNDKTGIIIEISQQFCIMDTKLPLVTMLIPFRIFNYTLGHFGGITDYFNRFIKKLVVRKRKVPLFLKRKLEIRDDVIVISDEVSKKKCLVISKLGIQNDSTTIYSPTSRYFMSNEVGCNSLKNKELSNAFNERGILSLSVELNFGGSQPVTSVRLNGSPLEAEFK